MLKRRKNQVLYRFRTQTSRYAEISQDSSIKNRQTIQEFGFAEFLSFCAFAKKNAVSLAKPDCKGGKSVGRNDRLWHLKGRYLPKAVSQSLRIRLWHLKSHTLPNAPSQSPRIRLWHLKSRYLPNAVSQSPTDRRYQIRKAWHWGSRGAPLVGVRLLRKENAPHF